MMGDNNSFSMNNTSQSNYFVIENDSQAMILDGSETSKNDFYNKNEASNSWITDDYPKDAPATWLKHPPIVGNTASTIMTESQKKSEEAACKMRKMIMIREKMISIIRNCYFEPGIWTAADQFFEDMKKECGSIDPPLLMLSDIVNRHLNDEHVLEGVLHILSNYDYEEINPVGITIAVACGFNHYTVIQDLLISCFERWAAVEAIPVLENMEFNETWLKEYRDDVLNQLKSMNASA